MPDTAPSRELLQNLNEIPRSDSIYGGTDDHGRFLLPTGLANNLAGSSQNLAYLLTERYLVALALTEICCRVGKGKVYYFPMEDGVAQTKNLGSKARTERACMFHRLPKLIYVPFIWGEEDQKIWLEMGHDSRHRLLNARAGGVPREQPVMPMDLSYETLERVKVRLNAYNDEHSGCKACLVIVPTAYLGWCTALQEHHRGLEFVKGGWEDGAGAYVIADDAILEHYRAPDGLTVVKRLWDMYFVREPRSLIKYQDILEAAMEFYSF